MQARGFVRGAAEVGRVWGSFRRSRFRREGGDVFGFHTETSTGRPYRRTSTSNHELDLAVSDRRAAVGPRVWILWTFHTAVWHLAAYGGYRVVLGVLLIDVPPRARPRVWVSCVTIKNITTVYHHRAYGWGAWYPNLPVVWQQDFDNQLNW